MINWLDVRNFVVIKQVQMTFETGLTVVTGETGAGKSVLVDALAVLLGDRTSGDIVRSGTDRCEIQAGFDVSHLPDRQPRHVVVPHRERRIGRDDLTLVALRPLHVARVALPLVDPPSPSF